MSGPVSPERPAQPHNIQPLPSTEVSKSEVAKKVGRVAIPILLSICAVLAINVATGFTPIGVAALGLAGFFTIALIAKAIKDCRKGAEVEKGYVFHKHANEYLKDKFTSPKRPETDLEKDVKKIVGGDEELAQDLTKILSEDPNSRTEDLIMSKLKNSEKYESQRFKLHDECMTLLKSRFPAYKFEKKVGKDWERAMILQVEGKNCFERDKINELQNDIESVLDDEKLTHDIIAAVKNPNGFGLAEAKKLLGNRAEKDEVMEICFAAIRNSFTIPGNRSNLLEGKAYILCEQDGFNTVMMEAENTYNDLPKQIIRHGKTAQDEAHMKWNLYTEVNIQGEEVSFMKGTISLEVAPLEVGSKPFFYIEGNTLINLNTGEITDSLSPPMQEPPRLI
ncbi:MAG: hypothetical protein WAM28_04075 [Chlamydiales bacterium]